MTSKLKAKLHDIVAILRGELTYVEEAQAKAHDALLDAYAELKEDRDNLKDMVVKGINSEFAVFEKDALGLHVEPEQPSAEPPAGQTPADDPSRQ